MLSYFIIQAHRIMHDKKVRMEIETLHDCCVIARCNKPKSTSSISLALNYIQSCRAEAVISFRYNFFLKKARAKAQAAVYIT